MLQFAPLAFGHIAGEQYGNGMQVWICHSSNPMIRMVIACQSKDVGPCSHALTEFIGKRGERGFCHSKRPKAAPGEPDGYPSGVKRIRVNGFRGADLIDKARQPIASALRASGTIKTRTAQPAQVAWSLTGVEYLREFKQF